MSKKVEEAAYGSAVGYGNNYDYATGPVSYSTWQNRVFRARHRSITDLGDKGNGENIQKPNNDFLDGFEIGDTVAGMGKKDQAMHTGNITSIEKDPEGEGLRVWIVCPEVGRVELSPTTLKLIDKKGGRIGQPQNPSDFIPPGEVRPDINPYNNFDLEEDLQPLKNLKYFKDFI
jgi:hypothetical protein